MLVPHDGRAPWGGPATGAHVPSRPATSHAWHCAPHVELQQYPSTQLPLLQLAPLVQVWPLLFRHFPRPSHARPAPQVVPAALLVNEHAPVLVQPVHVWHTAGAHEPAQQLPLAPIPPSAPHVAPDAHARQLAILHDEADVPAVVSHAPPVATLATHVPAPLQ